MSVSEYLTSSFWIDNHFLLKINFLKQFLVYMSVIIFNPSLTSLIRTDSIFLNKSFLLQNKLLKASNLQIN